MAKGTSKALFEQVAESLIEQLKAGTSPFQKPWSTDGLPPFELPYNAHTGKRYQGFNSIRLLMLNQPDPRWVTFVQAESNEWKVRRGEKGTMIQFVKTVDQQTKRDDNGKMVYNEKGETVNELVKLKRPIITAAYLFNAGQIEGIPKLERGSIAPLTWNPLERAELLIKDSGAIIHHIHGDDAFYSPRKDEITMPLREQFDDLSKYYATVLHELGHWTGHVDRLDRSLYNVFGSEAYGREELRAEIASILLGQELRIRRDPGQQAAYIASWIKVLQDTPFEIHMAAADAEKIFNYLMNIERKRLLGTEVESAVIPLAPEKSPRLKSNSNTLSLTDVIPYNGTEYKVLSHIKKGRFQIEDTSSGKKIIVAPSDGLFASLIQARQNSVDLHPVVLTSNSAAEPSITNNQSTIHR